jgi:hypothetical protein
MPDDVAKQFVGTWRQVSSLQRMADGTTRSNPMYGPGGVGYLIYTEANRVSAMVMDPGRPHWKSQSAPTEAELRSAMNGLTVYCGTYEVNPAEGSVTHHVELDKIPNQVGARLKRFFTISGNHLILRAAPPLPPGVVEYTITWERVAH